MELAYQEEMKMVKHLIHLSTLHQHSKYQNLIVLGYTVPSVVPTILLRNWSMETCGVGITE